MARQSVVSCVQFRPLIPLYAGRDLDLSLQQAAQRHLEGCDACRRSLAEYGRQRRLLSAVGRGQNLAPDVWASLKPRLADPVLGRSWPPRPRHL